MHEHNLLRPLENRAPCGPSHPGVVLGVQCSDRPNFATDEALFPRGWHGLCSRLTPATALGGRYRSDGGATVRQVNKHERSLIMLRLAIVFLVIAIIAAVLGATHAAFISEQIAWVLFVIFVILFIVSLLFGGLRRPPV